MTLVFQGGNFEIVQETLSIDLFSLIRHRLVTWSEMGKHLVAAILKCEAFHENGPLLLRF